MRSIVVGTAGHIDHGKTALVRALTGIDTDRLEEEKRRGITIDLGFAHLELKLPDREFVRIGFVDVPGHEKFVRNMLAGAGGIDAVMLIISADEGIKPQTREHFDICSLLRIRRGIVVLTKMDLVDAETLAAARAEVKEFVRGSFLEGAPIVAVSAIHGDGLADLQTELARLGESIGEKSSDAALRLPVDRVFVMKGHGTVVTGTLMAGSIRKEDEVEALPASDAEPQRLRVRSVQVHDEPVEAAGAGQRTALNLAAVGKEELERGTILTTPGLFARTTRADVKLVLLPNARPLKNRSRVHLHVHSSAMVSEVLLHGSTQLQPGETAFAQLRLEHPALLLPGDRFILRQFSPVITMGGGEVLDPNPRSKHMSGDKLYAFLEALATGDDAQVLNVRVARMDKHGLRMDDATRETGWLPSKVDAVANHLLIDKQIVRLGNVLLSAEGLESALRLIEDAVRAFHAKNPLSPGINQGELASRTKLPDAVFLGALGLLVVEKKLEIAGEQVRTAGRKIAFKDEEAEAKEKIEAVFRDAGLRVPALKEVIPTLPVDRIRAQKIVTLLLRDRVLIKLSDDLVFHRDALANLRKMLDDQKRRDPKINVGIFKDITGVSRKYAIPLLEWLDRERITRRIGDERLIL